MKLLFLGSFYPKERYSEIQSRSRYIDIPGNILQWSLLEGFIQNEINLTPITVPASKRMKNILFKGGDFDISNKVSGFCISFIDIIGLKQFTSSIEIFDKIKDRDDIDVIFIYSIQSHLLSAAIKYKKNHPKVKIILLVTDLPQYMNNTTSKLYHFLKDIEIETIEKYYKSVDGFVLLSKHMVEKLPINDKPFIIMEGIYEENNLSNYNSCQRKEGIKQVLYAGSLSKKYGILDLLDAFSNIENDNIRLIICGVGDAENLIKQACNKDNRIIFKGLVSREDVLGLQRQSHLLINPRTSEGEYTKYSFPSKTMEYLASGTPTLMYKLPGIPDEYFDYVYTIERDGVDELTRKIKNVLSLPDEELRNVGMMARDFILQNKGPFIQCSRIIDLANSTNF